MRRMRADSTASSTSEASDVQLSVSRRRATMDVGVQLGGRLVNLALGVLVTALLARTLGPAGLGTWSTIGAIIGLVSIFLLINADQVAVRRVAAAPEDEAKWFGALFYLKLIPSIASVAISVALLAVVAQNREMFLAGVLLALPVLTGCFAAMKVVFQVRLQNSVPVAVMNAQSIAWAAVVLVIYLKGGGLVALAAGSAIVTIGAALTIGVFAFARVRIRLSGVRERCWELLRTSVLLSVGAVLVTGYADVDRIIVYELAGAREAGLYGASTRIFGAAFFAPISISTTFFPLLAAAAAANVMRFTVLLQTSLELLVAAAIGCLAIAIAYSGPIITLVYGHEFDDAAPALPVLMGAFVLVSIGFLLDLLVIITAQQKRFLILAVVAFVLNAGLNLALVPVWGFMAAAVLTVVTEAFVVVGRWLIVRRHLPAQPAVGRLGRISVAAIALLGILLVMSATSVPVVPALLASVVLYPLLLFVSGAVGEADLRLMFSRERLD